jgi:hypothetical protein
LEQLGFRLPYRDCKTSLLNSNFFFFSNSYGFLYQAGK